VPKGTPPEIVAKLSDILAKAMADPEHNKRLEDQGLTVRVMVGDEYKAYYKDIHERSKKYVAWAKARPVK
jgi:tripartite-type tricarboxylate transporter receptor subunit TctC